MKYRAMLSVALALVVTWAITLLWAMLGPDGDPALVFAPSSLAPLQAEIDAALVAEDIAPVEWAFAGSQSLVSQIADGAPADVLITADRVSFDAALAAGFDAVDGGGLPVATNHLVLAVAPGNPGEVSSLADLTDPDLLIGLCAVEVPCGRLAADALDALGVMPAVDTQETSVRSLTTKIRAGELDAGLVYRSDAIAAELAVVDGDALAAFTTTYWSTFQDNPAHLAFMNFLNSLVFEQILIEAGFGS